MNEHPFDRLTPDFLMDAVESLGYLCDGRQFPLNSYENRVYQIGIEDQTPLIAKFYRPDRWTDQQIQEEHNFCFELQEQELPVVAPLTDDSGSSLFYYEDFRLSLFPRRGGRAPERRSRCEPGEAVRVNDLSDNHQPICNADRTGQFGTAASARNQLAASVDAYAHHVNPCRRIP